MSANASVVLVISAEHNRPSELIQPATAPHQAVNALARLLEGGAEGAYNLSIDGYSSAAAPVAASGTITLTYASIVAGTDTVTVGGQVLTSSSSTTDGTHWKVITDATATATNLATCINSNTNLKNVLTASAANGVVTITCNEKGTLGNLVGLASSNGTGAAVSAATLANGAGGMSGTATTWRLGL